MKQLGDGQRRFVDRCMATEGTRTWFGQIFRGDKIIFEDPELRRQREAQQQQAWARNVRTATGTAGTNVWYVQFS